MQLTFQEKSLWASLASTLLIFGIYFYKAFSILGDPQLEHNSVIGLFVGVVILITLVQIVLQTTLAIYSRKDLERKLDEREKLIGLKASQISHYVLGLGVWVTILSYYFNPSGIMLVHTILFFFIVSEIVGYAFQLILYRRGL